MRWVLKTPGRPGLRLTLHFAQWPMGAVEDAMGRAGQGPLGAHGERLEQRPRLEAAVSSGWCSRGPRGKGKDPGAGEGGSREHAGPEVCSVLRWLHRPRQVPLCSSGEDASGDTVG